AYTVSVSNAPGAATDPDVTITDDLSGTPLTSPQFCQVVSPATSCTPGPTDTYTGSIDVGSMDGGQTATYQIFGHVPSSQSDGNPIPNPATVTTSNANTGSPTSATATTTVAAKAAVMISKSAAPEPVIAGTDLTYRLVVSNAGPSDAQS